LPVVGEQQFAGHSGVHQATGRIESGCQFEGDRFRVNRRARRSAQAHQCFHTGPWLLVDALKAGCRQCPVLADQWDHVGDGAQRHQITQSFQVRLPASFPEARFSQMGTQGNEQVKGDAHTGQVSEVCPAVRPFGIDNGDGIFRLVDDRMMIGDDGMDAGLPGQGNGFGTV
jgi:hypothetical protein